MIFSDNDHAPDDNGRHGDDLSRISPSNSHRKLFSQLDQKNANDLGNRTGWEFSHFATCSQYLLKDSA